MSEALEQKLTELKLGRIRQIYPSWIEQASQGNLGYAEFLEQLLTEELLARQENQLRRKMKAAGFPYAATIEQFDFSARPELRNTITFGDVYLLVQHSFVGVPFLYPPLQIGHARAPTSF